MVAYWRSSVQAGGCGHAGRRRRRPQQRQRGRQVCRTGRVPTVQGLNPRSSVFPAAGIVRRDPDGGNPVVHRHNLATGGFPAQSARRESDCSTTRVGHRQNVGGRIPFWRCRRTELAGRPPRPATVARPVQPSAIRRLAVRSGGADRRLRVAPRCGRSVGRRVPPEHPCRARGACETAGSTRRRSEGLDEDAAH